MDDGSGDMSVPVRDFLHRRRTRALGSILGHAERSEWWETLKAGQREALRQSVIDALNGYHDAVLDLVKAEDGNFARNEEVIALLERIDAGVNRRMIAAG